uniref:Uncharacterized protein n=1 Tax=Trieres chinensis TaxID=1514140 RepID=A0A7S2A2U1_TRICV|mmetsp:Transcript_38642/g.78815  ORF Transcript_38642/g.78815 Transcript_38642/m.78815 type:complete len:418 (+) Transcript_38642:134-1387(+)|eukprot:CAMPEP_0183309242 /NCGR_PEP_ID=MMETSP0160_2-20130417/24629_1 /TAXON_ID=2839 ORGANISM="Odontella Sinensis, Strain Grunow 1884" /NCGR_SAMPLE_ID=MMETSP0160_2 /ASSEMBLY_ACC=CAM_ASM_000250 /LENGTH=417 /DNA_ID=CAMNT_0025473237 /DNA_START=94 /DNA_END=1347 /DNA_ORIENTATION=+
MMQGWGFGGAGLPQRFEEQYHCYSVAYADKAHLEGGDKILLPPSAFDTLARLQVDYPMLFRLESPQKGTLTHCGVLEFTAEEGSCYIPFWVMQNLLIEEGAVITITNVSLPKATFVKLRPQHVDFLEITNPRAVLEHALRNFSCVTKGDVICVPYNDRNYHFELMEVKPQDAACIIETDCNVDFDAPVGYKDPSEVKGSANSPPPSSAGSQAALANLPKQSAYAPAEARSSACPSPTPSSMSGASGSVVPPAAADSAEPQGTRIVDGKIVHPDEETEASASSGIINPDSATLAPRTGSTGVQRNAAIAIRAPEVDYWAVQAGDGARLDGKAPAPLKDRSGQELDLRKLRAEAAARRAAAAAKEASASSLSGASMASSKEDEKKPAGIVSKRKTRTGNKFSRLKKSGASAFIGSGNNT